MADFYDIDGILHYVVSHNIDLAPKIIDWWKLCDSMKQLGYTSQDFISVCRPHGAKPTDCAQEWKRNRKSTVNSPQGYIVDLAKRAGINILLFSFDHTQKLLFRSKGKSKREKTSIKTFDLVELQSYRECVKDTGLYRWLAGLFGSAAVDRVCDMYRLGGYDSTDPRGNRDILFPFVRIDGVVIDCRIQRYNMRTGSSKFPDGRRMHSTWLMAERNEVDRREAWCLFGEHLLSERRDAFVGVVEGEKGAVILAILYPSIVWVATQGAANLTPERCASLRGRKIFICPDRDKHEEWTKQAAALVASGLDCIVSTAVIRVPGGKTDSLDDVELRKKFPDKFA